MVEGFPIRVFFFNDTAATEIYTLSLHAALPIFLTKRADSLAPSAASSWSNGSTIVSPTPMAGPLTAATSGLDRKSTRLNSSHANISYAVFCLKKKQTAGRLRFVDGAASPVGHVS